MSIYIEENCITIFVDGDELEFERLFGHPDGHSWRFIIDEDDYDYVENSDSPGQVMRLLGLVEAELDGEQLILSHGNLMLELTKDEGEDFNVEARACLDGEWQRRPEFDGDTSLFLRDESLVLDSPELS